MKRDWRHSTVEQLKSATARIQQLVDSGAFFRLSRAERRRLIRPVRRGYARLVRLSAPEGHVPVTTEAAGALVKTVLGAAMVLTATGCDPFNARPSVWMQRDHYRIGNGRTAVIVAEAHDPEGDPLSFRWEVDGEVVPGETGGSLRLSRTPEAGTAYTVRVTVSDGSREDDAETLLSVGPPASTPEFDVATTRSALPTGFPSMGIYGITCALADLDGDGDMDLLDTAMEGPDGESRFRFVENYGAHDDPQFGHGWGDPFGLRAAVWISAYETQAITISPVFADLDADGDLDAVAAHYMGYEWALAFIENRGSVTRPAFDYPRRYHAGLASPLINGRALAIGDLDGDGDLDLLNGGLDPDTYAPTITFIRNEGAPEAPQFAPPVAAPFGIVLVSDFGAGYVPYFVTPELADLDNDGDLDLLVATYVLPPYASLGRDGRSYLHYLENTGTAEAPAFAAPSADIFGLTVPTYTIFRPRLVDLDSDGDLDLVAGILPVEDPDRELGYWDPQPYAFDFVYAENMDLP